ncbi:CRP-like cAMP-binding protein [Agrobacterium larrymoorei]|uniref:CRP-like cAMP-binding protein n=1 Tax=Agrobacterium larrymoorei TaxID=160699 RepID=A0AAJ2EQ13_9HYPH|nr:Crp/Fnr family transcriptional regulator [Agrobacterium larrymoorei]MDR6100556.1 CRP-like cAMP-binding protein [Agrobacterium larrymoorei]
MFRKKQTTTFPSIRIRAVDPWKPERDAEDEHLELSPSQRAELARVAESISFERKGAQIIAQGCSASHIFLLADGVAEAEHILANGERHIVAFYWPGDLFGLTEGGIYVNAVKGLTACKVYRFPINVLEAFLLKNPMVQQSFLIKAVHDLRSGQRQLVAMGRFDILRRLAMFLSDCSRHDKFFDPSKQILSLPMSRYDIADYLGTSAESITRALAVMEDKSIIRRISHRLIEINQGRLSLLASLD